MYWVDDDQDYGGNGKPPADCPATFTSVELPYCRVYHDHVLGYECVNAGDGWRSVRVSIHVCNDHDETNEQLPHGFVDPRGRHEDFGSVRWSPTSHGAKENLKGASCSNCGGSGEVTESWVTGLKGVCTKCEGSGRVSGE